MKGKDTHFPTEKTLLDHPVDLKVSTNTRLLTGGSLHGAEGYQFRNATCKQQRAPWAE